MKIRSALIVLAGLALSASPAMAQKLTFTLNWVAGGDHAPYFYAQKMGLYKDAGVNVEFETGRGSAAPGCKSDIREGHGAATRAGSRSPAFRSTPRSEFHSMCAPGR